MLEEWANVLPNDPMRAYRAKRDSTRKSVHEKYTIKGFISSGTYGRVYKAQSTTGDSRFYAIKKFKPDKEGEVVTYTGISQSAIREIALNREIKHENVVALSEVLLEDKSIYMVFEYAEHDFLQVIHHHAQTIRSPIPPSVLKSMIYQLLNGVLYLHTCHILHRDLKPANILITSDGVVKIGDLGLARLVHEPLQALFAGDKVVVTIWYRAPELLMGARHYTKAVDIWAVGCVMAELASLRPIFKGEEAKLDSKKNVPFQRDQIIRIFEILGTPDVSDWPSLKVMPEYQNMKKLDKFSNRFHDWCQTMNRVRSKEGYDFLKKLFAYDPEKRLTAKQAMEHRWFQVEEPKPTKNVFAAISGHHLPPQRRITQDEASSSMLPTNAAVQAQQQQISQGNSTMQPGSVTSFTSGGGLGYSATGVVHNSIRQQHYNGQVNYGAVGVSRLGPNNGGGEGGGSGGPRKKARLG